MAIRKLVMQPIDLALTDEVRGALSSRYFRVRAETTDSGEIELLVMGVVGDGQEGLDAKSVVSLLSQNPKAPVRVRINSPGGLAFDGITMHNALVRHAGQVTTEIEGMAASAAAVIAMAGSPVKMAANGQLFIHQAWGLAVGNQGVMNDMADWLAKVDQAIADTFAAKSGQAPARIAEMMAGKVDGTTLSAAEALELGLVDEVIPVRGKTAEGQESGARDQGAGVRSQVSEAASRLEAEAHERLKLKQELVELEAQ